jgi:RecB family endonuclease NucS
MADSQANRQILGISVAPELAREVKTEAAARGMSLRKLFEEMWAGYKATSQKAKS